MAHGSYTEQFECLRCDTVQSESKGKLTKGAIVRCRGCGGVTYPVNSDVKKVPAVVKARVCKTCGAKLRASNPRQQCGTCWGLR